MIKVIFALALLSSTLFCASSAQQQQTFADEVEAAVEEFFSEALIYTETELESSYVIGEYDWILTDNDQGQYEVNVHTVSASEATNLGGALTDLIESLGEAIQDRADEIESELDGLTGAEEDVIEIQQENDATAANIRQFGSELQANASRISANLVQNYNGAAANYTSNVNHATDQLNNAINNIHNYNSPDQLREFMLQAIADIIGIREEIRQVGSEGTPINSTIVSNSIENVNSQNINEVAQIVAANSTNATNPQV